MTNLYSDGIDWSNLIFDYEIRELTIRAIAAEYGCSAFPVYKQLHKQGAKMRQGKGHGWNPVKMAEINERGQEALAAHDAGSKIADLADFYGYSYIGMYVLLRRAQQQREESST